MVIRLQHLIILGLIIAGLTLSFNSQANLTIRITKGNDQALPIAVVPFLWEGKGALKEDIASIISANLERTGLFKNIPRTNFVSLPSTTEEVVYRDWRLLKANYLVIGKIEAAGGSNVNITYELFDIVGQKSLLKLSSPASLNDLRTSAHAFSDTIYERLTGQKGIFSTKIAYVTAIQDVPIAQRKYQLHVADADGQRSKVLLTSKKPLLSPDWSPDGKKLAYVSFETGRAAIFIQEIETGKRYQLTNFRGLNGAPAWSPDGKKIAMTLSRDGNAEIYIYLIQERRLIRVTNHYEIDTEPSWSPDGKSLVFTSGRSGGPQIYQIDLLSGIEKRMTFAGNYNARPRYSPNGQEVFIMHRPAGARLFSIAAFNMNTQKIRILTTSPLDHSPSAAPNGAMVIYALKSKGKGVLGVVSTDGRIQYELPTVKGDVLEPAWSPYLH